MRLGVEGEDVGGGRIWSEESSIVEVEEFVSLTVLGRHHQRLELYWLDILYNAVPNLYSLSRSRKVDENVDHISEAMKYDDQAFQHECSRCFTQGNGMCTCLFFKLKRPFAAIDPATTSPTTARMISQGQGWARTWTFEVRKQYEL